MTKRHAADESSFVDEMFIAEPSQTATGLFSIVEGLRPFNNPECRPWLEMCIAVDQGHDFSSLLNLLQSSAPAEVMPFLRDLFERHGLIAGVKGNLNRTPLYRDTAAETLLAMACEDVEQLKKEGMKVEEAIEVAAGWHAADGVTQNALSCAVKKQSGAYRRWKERVGRRKGAAP